MKEIADIKLMYGLKLEDIAVNRKMLADNAIDDVSSFTELAEEANKSLDI